MVCGLEKLWLFEEFFKEGELNILHKTPFWFESVNKTLSNTIVGLCVCCSGA